MKTRHAALLFILSLAIAMPVWWAVSTKWPVATDIIFYSTALKHFSQQLWAGEWYPRWLIDINAGYGSPVFVFYPPAAFYIASLLEWLSPHDPHGLGRFVISVQLAIITSGVTAYMWMRQTLPDRQAVTGSYIYAAFPAIALLLYYDYGMPQLWALAWLPLLLLCAHRLASGVSHAFFLLAFAYALLALTHLPTTLIFCLVPVAYAACFAPRGKRLRAAVLALMAGALGAAMTAFFLVPSKLSEPFIMSHFYLSGNGDYRLNFWKVRNLVAALIVLLPLAGYFLELPRPRLAFVNRQVAFCLGVCLLAMFMTSPLSRPVWDLLTPLQYLQFPWRMMVIAIPAAAYITALWLPNVRSRSFVLIFGALIFAVNGYAGASSLFFISPKPLGDTLKLSLLTSTEYTTRWMHGQGMRIYKVMPEALVDVPTLSVQEGKATLSVLKWQPRQIVLDADIESPYARVQLRRLYFPGWEADNAIVDECKALLCLTLEKGRQTIALQQILPMEHESLVFSVLSLIFALAGLGYTAIKRKPHDQNIR